MKKTSAQSPSAKPSTPAKRKRNAVRIFGDDRLGLAPRDWDDDLSNLDVGSADINAVRTWEEADVAAAQNRMQFEDKIQEEHQQQQHLYRTNVASQQGGHSWLSSSRTSAPGVVLNPFAEPMQHDGVPRHSDNTVITTSTGGSSRSGYPVHPGMPVVGAMQGTANQKSSDATVVTTSTGASSRSGQSAYSGMSTSAYGTTVTPPLPPPPATKTQASSPGVPKAILYQFYGKKPRRKQLSNEDYFSWNNGGKPHELRFTTIFQCPLTGECFPSGRYGDPRYYDVEITKNNKGDQVEVIWYTKKAFAEHGAAARCYDCLLYREALSQGNPAANSLSRMCTDLPYLRENSPPLPPVPNLIMEKISQTQQRIKDFMG